MRLFIALDIDAVIRRQIERFLEGVCGFAPEARWVRPESLHITLKFIGERAEDALASITYSLEAITAKPFEVHFQGYGFFPSPKSARVFWVGISAGPELAELASKVDSTMAVLGIAKEDHPFSPHLTLARGGAGSSSPRRQEGDRPNRNFQHLQEKLAALPSPDFGTMNAREFFLYRSKLSPKGSQYTKLAEFKLK